MIRISRISAAQTWPVRHRVMWPREPFDYVKVPEDEVEDGSVRHYGLFCDDTDSDHHGDGPVSVVSVFLTPISIINVTNNGNSSKGVHETPTETAGHGRNDNGLQAQFRKFATDTKWQGRGYGSQLLAHMMNELETMDNDLLSVKRIWCNARVDKMGFYRRFGMSETDETFSRGHQDYVIMEKWQQSIVTE